VRPAHDLPHTYLQHDHHEGEIHHRAIQNEIEGIAKVVTRPERIVLIEMVMFHLEPRPQVHQEIEMLPSSRPLLVRLQTPHFLPIVDTQIRYYRLPLDRGAGVGDLGIAAILPVTTLHVDEDGLITVDLHHEVAIMLAPLLEEVISQLSVAPEIRRQLRIRAPSDSIPPVLTCPTYRPLFLVVRNSRLATPLPMLASNGWKRKLSGCEARSPRSRRLIDRLCGSGTR
jgi:hypothetical protein